MGVKTITRLLYGAAIGLILPELAYAQSVTDEIVVTAQKRDQKTQDVGIAITAASGQQLRNFGFTASTDIAKIAPNISISGSYGGLMSQFSIRGVTQNDYSDFVESVVAVYVDETYIAQQQGQSFATFDINRVEALKGPQGTLFGRNATAGLVHYVTNRPTEKLEGYADVTYASYNQARLEAALNVPISSKVWTRLSGVIERSDGYVHNTYPNEPYVPASNRAGLGTNSIPGAGGDLGGVKYNWALRGQLLAQPSDTVELWLSAFGGKVRSSSAPYQQVATIAVLDAQGNQIDTLLASKTNSTCAAIQVGQCVATPYSNGATRPRAGGDYFGYIAPRGWITSSDYAFDNSDTLVSYGFSGKLTARIGGITLTAISDYKNFKKNFHIDLDAGPENQFFWIGDAASHDFTQEIRLNGKIDRLTWVTGLYYLNSYTNAANGLGALPDSVYAFPGFDQPRSAQRKDRSYSAFGQLEYKVLDNLTAIAGIRGTQEDQDYKFQVYFVTPTTGGNPLDWSFAPSLNIPGLSQGPYAASSKELLWSWKLGLNWTPASNLLLYTSASQGAKAGNYNAGGPPLAVSEIPYGSERLIAYEAGLKSSPFGRGSRLNASAFYYDYKNYQASRWTGVSSIITNNPAYVYGLDVEASAKIVNGLEGIVNFGYQYNQVKNVLVGTQFRNVHMTFSPNFTSSAMIRYTVPMTILGGEVSLQADGNYQSSVFHNLANYTADKLAGYVLFNGRISWKSASMPLKVDVFAKNIFNKVYDTIGFDVAQVAGANEIAHGRPRWVGVTAHYSF